MTLRAIITKAKSAIDANDIICLGGLVCLGYGLERIYSGSGFAAAGAVLIYATLRRR